MIATTKDSRDDVIVDECGRLEVECFRGEELDVLDRYYQAALSVSAGVVVRITSDCPLVDPEVTDLVIRTFLDQRPDYASNTMIRTYPRGLDTEVMTSDALARAWREAHRDYQRVHVTPYLYENPGIFKTLQVTAEQDHSDYRWTLDTPEDLAFLRAVYGRVGNDDHLHWRDLLNLLEHEPALVELNRHITMKALHEG